MAATAKALIQIAEGSSWATAYGSAGSQFDLLQIIDQGGSVLLNITYAGVVHSPASGATAGTSVGVFQSSRTSGTVAQLFAASFTNPGHLDILQLVGEGGAVAKYIDYLGVSH